MQRVLMLIRYYEAAPGQKTLLAAAELIGAWFEQAGLVSPVPPIDYDAHGLECVRASSRETLLKRLPRSPTALELAVEVAGQYAKRLRSNDPPIDSAASTAALRKMRRLIREAQRYEYVFSAALTGREPLPPPRAAP
jgi:hypothetical protein